AGTMYPSTSHQKRATRSGSAQSKVTWTCLTDATGPPWTYGLSSSPSMGGDRGSDRSHVLGLRTLLPLGHLELDLLALVEFAVAGGRDGAVVDEDVWTAAILLNESKSLVCVEPFDGAGRHECLFMIAGTGRVGTCGSSTAPGTPTLAWSPAARTEL